MENLAMKQTSVSAVFLAAMLATISGCANLQQESAGEYIDDAVITTKVKASLLDQPSLKSFEIHVETFKGTVNLSGYVASQSTIDKAVEVASGVNGVRSVKNDMRLR
jgi:osmotically-inducible protein OsmY